MTDVGEIALFLEDNNGSFYTSQKNLTKWKFKCPEKRPLIYKDQPYYALNDFKDLEYQFNSKRMSIHITVGSSHLYVQDIDFSGQAFVIPMKSSFGGYFNYDTLAQKSKENKQLSGIFNAGLFNEFGTGFSGFLAQHIQNCPKAENQFVRLNSNWRIDDPLKMRTLILGDSYTMPGMWGQSVGFGGIQWGTNFETQPTFITFPTPSMKGEAVVPSLIDLYVNNIHVGHSKTAAGPFLINTIPVTTGEGIIKVVTTDLLGRQQQLSVPYYASRTLLKPGLQNYSYSVGAIRRNFGIESNDYGKLAFSGNHQYGFTDNFTGETHLDLLQKQQVGGLGGNYLISNFGVLNLAGATSTHSGKMGGLVSAGFQHHAIRGINFGTNIQATTKSFAHLGKLRHRTSCNRTPYYRVPRYLFTSFVGMGLYDGASLGISYTRLEHRHFPNLSFLNVSYNQTLWERVALNISAFTNVGCRSNQSIYLTLSYALTDNTSLNVGGIAQREHNQQTVQVQRNLPLGPGYGYNLYAGNGEQRNYQASVTGQTNEGTYTAAVASYDGTRAGQVQASGALAFLNQDIYLSRTLGQSFAVVKVADYKDVKVYYQNQPMGYTDEEGTLLIPRLLPYQNNPIRVELQDLPLDAQLQTEAINAIPYYRSGLVLDFPVKSSRGAMMRLVLPSGEPVPIEAVVSLRSEEFPIGYEGEIYITGLEENNILNVKYKDEAYTCPIKYKKTKDPLPHLGTIQCQK